MQDNPGGGDLDPVEARASAEKFPGGGGANGKKDRKIPKNTEK